MQAKSTRQLGSSRKARPPGGSRAILNLLERMRAKLHDLDQKLDHLIRNFRREGGVPAHFNHTLSEY